MTDHAFRMEQAILGAVMDHPEFVDLMLERLPLEHFHQGTKQIAHAVATLATDGRALSPTSVMEQLRIDGTISLAGNLVMDCWTQGNHVLDPRQEIETLARLYALDEAKALSSRLYHGTNEMDLSAWVALADEELDRIRKIEEGSQPPVMTYLEDALVGEDVSVDWAVPGLLPKGTATMLTAEVGVGKSTVLRQIALAAMGGFQPFDPGLAQYEPQRVLLIDCEVSRNQLVRSLRSLWSYGNRFCGPISKSLAWESHQSGLNLSEAHDQGWLHRLVREHKATMLVVGPVYRFTDADLNTEEGVRTWQRCFEPLLADGISIVTEHHAPNGQPGALRALRPIGSSAMRRWFAQGISLRTQKCELHEINFCPTCPRTAGVESWRGSRDEEARWPRYLRGAAGQVWWLEDHERDLQGSQPM